MCWQTMPWCKRTAHHRILGNISTPVSVTPTMFEAYHLREIAEDDHYDSLGSCGTNCQDDYAFAVVQGTTCWCSNYAPGDQVPLSECSGTCPGYPYEFCGSTTGNLYGYLRLKQGIWGTSYTSTPAATTTEVSIAPTPPPVQTTVVLTSAETIVSTRAIVSTQVVSNLLRSYWGFTY